MIFDGKVWKKIISNGSERLQVVISLWVKIQRYPSVHVTIAGIHGCEFHGLNRSRYETGHG